MYKNMLNKNFFNKNVFEEMSAEKLVYSVIEMPQLSEMARDFVVNITDRDEEEANMLKNETNTELIIKAMRGKCDNLNYGILYQKVLENEDELLPKIIAMLVKSGNSVFIEHAAKIIPQCNKNYSKELLEILDKVRSPYCVSLICVDLGFLASEDAIPIIYDKYFELKKTYKNESYAQGPLLALFKLKERFYMHKK